MPRNWDPAPPDRRWFRHLRDRLQPRPSAGPKRSNWFWRRFLRATQPLRPALQLHRLRLIFPTCRYRGPSSRSTRWRLPRQRPAQRLWMAGIRRSCSHRDSLCTPDGCCPETAVNRKRLPETNQPALRSTSNVGSGNFAPLPGDGISKIASAKQGIERFGQTI